MKFQHVPVGQLRQEEAQWLGEIPGLDMIEVKAMIAKIASGEWKLWRLAAPAIGLAVTYPYQGRLFIYYLRGHRLFGRLSRDDLLEVARHEGLSGMSAETQQIAMMRILSNLGFVVRDSDPYLWYMELDDVRSAHTNAV